MNSKGLATILVGVIGAVGLMEWHNIAIDYIGIDRSIFIGLGIDYSIHIQNGYGEEERDKSNGNIRKLR